MINNKKEVLKEISKIKNLKDINHNLFDIFWSLIKKFRRTYDQRKGQTVEKNMCEEIIF